MKESKSVVYTGVVCGHIVSLQKKTEKKLDDGSWKIYPPRLVAHVIVELENGTRKTIKYPELCKNFELNDKFELAKNVDVEEERVGVYEALCAKVLVGTAVKVLERQVNGNITYELKLL